MSALTSESLPTNTMKALVKAHPREGLWMQNEPMPEIGVDDVLIKVKRYRCTHLELG